MPFSGRQDEDTPEGKFSCRTPVETSLQPPQRNNTQEEDGSEIKPQHNFQLNFALSGVKPREAEKKLQK